eukprot:4168261-Alexandrium_andersonii.AAC.1
MEAGSVARTNKKGRKSGLTGKEIRTGTKDFGARRRARAATLARVLAGKNTLAAALRSRRQPE